jgi:hypothetical protein
MEIVKPLIREKEAIELIKKKRKFFIKRIKIVKAELAYLPYYLFKLQINFKEGEKEILAVSDGVSGSFAYWSGEGVTFIKNNAINFFDFRIDSKTARKEIETKYREILFNFNLQKRDYACLKGIKEIKKFYYPYWIVYFKKGNFYDFKAIDAVSGEIQGVKMKRVFIKALWNSEFEKRKS